MLLQNLNLSAERRYLHKIVDFSREAVTIGSTLNRSFIPLIHYDYSFDYKEGFFFYQIPKLHIGYTRRIRYHALYYYLKAFSSTSYPLRYPFSVKQKDLIETFCATTGVLKYAHSDKILFLICVNVFENSKFRMYLDPSLFEFTSFYRKFFKEFLLPEINSGVELIITKGINRIFYGENFQIDFPSIFAMKSYYEEIGLIINREELLDE